MKIVETRKKIENFERTLNSSTEGQRSGVRYGKMGIDIYRKKSKQIATINVNM